MLVSVSREEYWPVYEIHQNKFATKEISEELYNRYIDTMKEFQEVQDLLGDVYYDRS